MKRLLVLFAVLVALLGLASSAQAQSVYDLRYMTYEGQPIEDLLSAGGRAFLFGPGPPAENPQPGYHDNGRGGNSFVNDPCLDPPPPNQERTVQSETEIAVLNTAGSMGKKMVAGYNDSWGDYDRNQGLTGYAYSVDGGNTWVDGGGLPPVVPGPGHPLDPGKDGYFGDPVVAVHHATQTFYYASLYKRPDDTETISVNRGVFAAARPAGFSPPAAPESRSDTRCLNNPSLHGVPQPANTKEKVFWTPPVGIVQSTVLTRFDLVDKEWLYVDQVTGTLFVTYTRFARFGGINLETVRCTACASKPTITSADWEGPFVIVAGGRNPLMSMPITVPTATGTRVIVTWWEPFVPQAIRYAVSDDSGTTWSAPRLVKTVNEQGRPPGYDRGPVPNQPYIAVNRGLDDAVITEQERRTPGFGDVFITYYDAKPGFQPPMADIYVSRSTNLGESFETPVKVNDDPGTTSHVFPSVQVNKNGYVYVSWLDRRRDPANELTDAWANVSKDGGTTYGPDRLQTDVATSWHTRNDGSPPNFGDYNSSDLLAFNDFVIIWADGRFPPPAPAPQAGTPDVIFTIANGLGVGELSK